MQAYELIDRLKAVRVVPVIDPKQKDECLTAIDALVSGGATAIEITLRSEVAIDMLRALRSRYPTLIIGAGSVMDKGIYDKAVDLGADFTISPGRDLELETYVEGKSVVHVPGVVTSTEIIAARKAGQTLLKFYPSEANGGASALKDLCRIFPDMLVMPSGGIKEAALPAYAALPGVLSVGGSWMYSDAGMFRSPDDASRTMAASIEIMSKDI